MKTNTRELIVAWQDPDTRRWLPVGRFGRVDGKYYFVYTEGAQESSNFEPFGRMRDLNTAYVSESIFPLFANRLLSKSRPDYKDYIRWLGLANAAPDELEVLARSGGVRATDKLEIFPCPAPNATGRYVGYFFCHGLRYLLPEHITRIKDLVQGQRLLVALDVQNPADREALLLRIENPVSMVGYCPRYLAAEFGQIIRQVGPDRVIVTVEQVNPDAPYDLRLLCKIESEWPDAYAPCFKGAYKPLVDLHTLLEQKEVNHIVG